MKTYKLHSGLEQYQINPDDYEKCRDRPAKQEGNFGKVYFQQHKVTKKRVVKKETNLSHD